MIQSGRTPLQWSARVAGFALTLSTLVAGGGVAASDPATRIHLEDVVARADELLDPR